MSSAWSDEFIQARYWSFFAWFEVLRHLITPFRVLVELEGFFHLLHQEFIEVGIAADGVEVLE